jgi:hypothetical protein
MGGDYYDGRDVVTTTSSSGYSAQSAQAVGQTTKIHSSLDPHRWTDENLQCESLNPIIFALDVTGSMGDWTKIIYDKMPMFYGQIMMQKYLTDPAISFCAIGDVTCDEAPLQVTEFGQGKAIDQLISKMYLEGGGGGNKHESYDLAANFYSSRVDLLNCEIPFFFVTGDEGFWENESAQQIQKIFGQGIKEKTISSTEVWKKLLTQYNVFHIKKPFHSVADDANIKKQWNSALGQERVLNIVTPKACIDVMLGAIAITSGVRDLAGYITDMKVRGQTEERITEVTKALKPYADKLAQNKINIIKHQVSAVHIDQIKQNNISNTNTDNSNSVNIVSTDEITEIIDCVQKQFTEELEEDQLNYVEKLKSIKNAKGDSVPKEFICPITGHIIYDPVMTADGHTFERKAIELWLEKHDYSPLTKAPIDSKILLPNFALKQLIRDYVVSSI